MDYMHHATVDELFSRLADITAERIPSSILSYSGYRQARLRQVTEIKVLLTILENKLSEG